MVRILMGTLLQIGSGELSMDSIDQAFTSKNVRMLVLQLRRTVYS